MLERARDAGVPMAWVTGDTVHGRSRALRSWLEDEGLHHVLAVPRNEELWAGTDLWRVDEVHAAHGDREWHRLSAGSGSKGEWWYDWQCRILAEPEAADWGHYLLFRRSCTDPDDWQAYVAGRRWVVEHAFEGGQAGSGPGRLRGAQRARLVPARDAGAVGPGPAGGRAAAALDRPAFKLSRGLAGS